MRLVPIETLALAMANHAPPAWCKLTIIGAIHTSRVQLFARTGRVRAFLPSYAFNEDDSRTPLPPRLRWTPWTKSDLIERYGLDDVPVPNQEPVEVWLEEWKDQPRQIALGWAMFHEPWDWGQPKIAYEQFEVPYDYKLLFGYDDIHPEGDPDIYLNYDVALSGLSLKIEDAESLAPMIDAQPLSYVGHSFSPMKRIGRPKRSGFEDADQEIVQLMIEEKRHNPEVSIRFLADKYADEAVGHGTRDSKVKRLERRLTGLF